MSSEFTLEQVAKHDENPNVRIAAVQQLDKAKSEFTLEQVAKHDDNPRVREAAVRQLGK